LDERTTLDAALRDADGFIQEIGTPVVIDEIQRAPDLMRAIKLVIDRKRQAGRYLLTGSANVLGLDAVPETLAGRMAVHRLDPFSFSERLGRSRPPLLDLLFGAESAGALVGALAAAPGLPLDSWKQSVLSGGYPTPALMDSPESRATWFESFRQTYVDRDLRDLARIANLPDFGRLMTLLANRTSQLSNTAELSRDIAMPVTTLRRYLNLLQLTFQITLLTPFASNRTKRLVKTPKVYWSDTGMASHLAAVSDWSDLVRRELVGAFTETWVHIELRKLMQLEAPAPELSFWRTSTGREVDFVIERGDRVVGIEVTGASTLERRKLDALDACRESLGKRWQMGVLLHGGTEAVALDERTAALPIALAFQGGSQGR
jgi:predicted AAA+ superfamily ATPase